MRRTDLLAATWVAIVALTVSQGGRAAAVQSPEPRPTELAWVGLYTPELLGWLENENRLGELCTASRSSAEWYECSARHMEPKVAVIPVRAAPGVDAARVGEIVVVALPGRGFRAFASRGAAAARFTPDLYDVDWGYGPYFHQTVLERRAGWFRIPVPAIGAGWIGAEEWTGRYAGREGAAHVEVVTEGQIVTTPQGDVVVLGIEDDVLRVRAEQEADMWCHGGDPPPLSPWQEARIPFDELFDAEGHLRISFKYTRGC